MSGYTYPPGYLGWGALPSFRRPHPCRFCGALIPEATSGNYTCPAEDCQRRKAELTRERQRRYDRRYYLKTKRRAS